MKTFILEEKNRAQVNKYLKTICWDGSTLLEVKRVTRIRTLKQNALYWMWLRIIAADTGYTRGAAQHHQVEGGRVY